MRDHLRLPLSEPLNKFLMRRIARDLHSPALIDTLDCDAQPKETLHRRPERPVQSSAAQEQTVKLELCGTKPMDVVPAEHYEQLWEAVEHSACDTFKACRARAPKDDQKKGSIPTVNPPPPPAVPPEVCAQQSLSAKRTTLKLTHVPSKTAKRGHEHDFSCAIDLTLSRSFARASCVSTYLLAPRTDPPNGAQRTNLNQ